MGRHAPDDSSTERELLRALIEEQQLNRELLSLVFQELKLISQLLDNRFNAPVGGSITVK